MGRLKLFVLDAGDWGDVGTTLAAGLLLPIQLGAGGASVEAFFAYAVTGGALISGGRCWEDGDVEIFSLLEGGFMTFAVLLVFGSLPFLLGRALN